MKNKTLKQLDKINKKDYCDYDLDSDCDDGDREYTFRSTPKRVELCQQLKKK